MFEVTQRESDIIESIRSGMLQSEISTKFGYVKSTTFATIKRCVALGLMEKEDKGVYNVIIKQSDYTINPFLSRNPDLTGKELKKKTFQADNVPTHIQDYLRDNYKRKPRTQLASDLGIRKTILNTYLIEMGLGS